MCAYSSVCTPEYGSPCSALVCHCCLHSCSGDVHYLLLRQGFHAYGMVLMSSQQWQYRLNASMLVVHGLVHKCRVCVCV